MTESQSLAERIAVLESKHKQTDRKLEEIDGKIDRLLALANMGKGAWWAMLKIGGIGVVLVGAAAWVWQQFHAS